MKDLYNQLHKKLHKAVNDVHEIRMTSTEKDMVLKNILSKVPASTPKINMTVPIKSPWTIYSFGLWIKKNPWSYALIVIISMSLAGSSVAFAAEGSLPGDPLYPVKIDVTEPIRTALAVTPQAKATLAADFADQRMQEGEILATEGKLDATKQAQLSSLITTHTNALDENLTVIASSDPQVAHDISVTFQANMDRHARRLEALLGQASTTENENLLVIATSTATASTTIPNSSASYSQNSYDQTNKNFHANRNKKIDRNEATSSVPSFVHNENMPISNLVNSAETSENAISKWNHDRKETSDIRGNGQQNNDSNGGNKLLKFKH